MLWENADTSYESTKKSNREARKKEIFKKENVISVSMNFNIIAFTKTENSLSEN